MAKDGSRLETFSWRISRLKAGRYQLPGKVEVVSGDVVADVGAYVGEFSVAMAPVASRVLAFEPDPLAYKALCRNLAGLSNVSHFPLLLWNKKKMVPFYCLPKSADSSVFKLPRGRRCERMATTLEEVLDEGVDFLKVDGEGAEPEIIEGLGELRVPKIAVDVSAERKGRRTEEAVKRLLEGRGYTVWVRGNFLFANFLC